MLRYEMENILLLNSTAGTATRSVTFLLFTNEIFAMLMDMRWALLLLLLLILADFRYGWGESRVRYGYACRQGNKVPMEHYKWRMSRAIRRTFNKLADYIILMLLAGAIGMAVFEPLGIQHTWGSWVGAAIACFCELASIFGHFFYLRGVTVEKRTLAGFLKALIVALAKKKNEDVGEAVEEAFKNSENKNE